MEKGKQNICQELKEVIKKIENNVSPLETSLDMLEIAMKMNMALGLMGCISIEENRKRIHELVDIFADHCGSLDKKSFR